MSYLVPLLTQQVCFYHVIMSKVANGEGILVIRGKLGSRDFMFIRLLQVVFVKALNVFTSSIFFPLYLNIQVSFMENIFSHGPNSLLLNLSKNYPMRFILSPENYLSFLYEAGISSYKQVLSITGFACPSTLHVFV